MRLPRLTPHQQGVLRDQVIDDHRPGAVLHDFQRLLDYVGTDGVKAAGKYHLLPLAAIPELDPRLSRPLNLPLERPQLRSHPYLQGLHLLLRASGLGRVEGEGARSRLSVDPGILEQWNALNATERYFNLLEAWLRFSQPEMVGEGEGGWGLGSLTDCLQAWRFLPARGQKFNTARPQDAYVRGFARHVYHVALMDLFGLLDVEQAKQPVVPWTPAALRHAPFGDAVFTILASRELGYPLPPAGGDETDVADDEAAPPVAEGEEDGADGAADFGRWQPLFQPYFPAWQRNLVIPEPERRDGVFVFRVSLGHVWRRIAVRADHTVDDLVRFILRSVRFDDEHLYDFTYPGRFGVTAHVAHPWDEEGVPGDEVEIGSLPLQPGATAQLLYDFGDSWRFVVKLERVEPPGSMKAPRVLEKHGKAPKQYGDLDGW